MLTYAHKRDSRASAPLTLGRVQLHAQRHALQHVWYVCVRPYGLDSTAFQKSFSEGLETIVEHSRSVLA